MTDSERKEIIQRINDLEARIMRLEMMDDYRDSKDWSKAIQAPASTQACTFDWQKEHK